MPSEVRIYTFKLPKEEWGIGDRFEELAKLDRVSVSELVRQAIKEYVEKHKEGNPQKPLVPFTKVWESPILEKRHDNLEWMESLVSRNEGKMSMLELISQFAVMSGLKDKTAKEYADLLWRAKRIKIYGGKVYSNKGLQTRTETPK